MELETSASALEDALSAALTYEARGFSVIPLVPMGKRPAVKLAPFLDGSQRMTADAIRTHWTLNPQHGVGIVTGAPSRVVVVDVDPRNGGSVEAVLAQGATTDCVARTGGGGRHFIFRSPGGDITCGKTILLGVDRKARGGYIVVPPSIHPSGNAYVWEKEGEPGDLPPWVLESPSPTSLAGEERGQWVADTISHPERAVPGTQEDTLTRLAWGAAGHMPYDVGLAMLMSWAAQLALGNEFDPWTEEHVRNRLDRAVEKRKDEFPVTFVGAGASGASASAVGRKRHLTPEAEISIVVAACRSAKARSLEQPPEVEWIAPLVLPRGSQQTYRMCAHCSAPMIPGDNWWPRSRPGRTPVPYICRPCERRRATQYATTIERRYSSAQYQARKRGVTWHLSFAAYKDLLTPNACWCCAGPLSPTGSGIDRIDATKPYETANVVPLCGACRTVRGFALTLDETKLIVHRRRALQRAVA
jgi:hypothetical protein